MVAGAAPRLCLNSPTGISCFFLSLQSGNQLTNPQMSGNLQGFNIQSHYQWRKPLVLHLLVTLLLINQQKHFIPPLPPPPSPRNTIGNGYSVLLIDIKKISKFGIGNLSLTWNVQCRYFQPWLKISASEPESWSRWWRSLCWPVKTVKLTIFFHAIHV